MRWSIAVLVAAGLWLSALDAFANSKAPPAVEAFGRVPAISRAVLSPNGQLVAWIDSSGAVPMIEIFDLEKRARLKRVNVPADLKLRNLEWADDEILLILGSISKAPSVTGVRAPLYEWFRTVAMDVHSGRANVLLHRGEARNYVTGATLLALRTDKPKTVVMSSWDHSMVNYRQESRSRMGGGRKDRGWTYNLYEVDTRSGEGKLVNTGTPFTRQWVIDANGEGVARGEWEAQRNEYTVLYRRGSGWSEIFRLETDSPPSLLAMSRDGAAILMLGALHGRHTGIWRLPTDGSAPQLAFGDEARDVVSVERDPYSGEVIGAWLGGAETDLHWIDEDAGKQAKALQNAFAGKHISTISRSADNTRALVAVGAHAMPTVYYLVDFKRGAADILGEEYPGLVDVALGEVRNVKYAARDGYEIPAYLTVPPAGKAEKLPLVVLPHGGPESHDSTSFDFVAQFLASRGYAVLQPQFRGSTGFGEAHRQAGYRQWGKLMQDDVTDGVRAMVEQGVADSKRICIAGMSYGGYAALAGAAFTPELYACAISVNGVSDLPEMLGFVRVMSGDESDRVAYWKEHIGPPDDPDVPAKSPARAARNVRAPILLMHGLDDSIVPVAQSRAMMKALGGGAPHELIELSGEDHWLSRSETRIRVLAEMERFLAKHLAVTGQAGD